MHNKSGERLGIKSVYIVKLIKKNLNKIPYVVLFWIVNITSRLFRFVKGGSVFERVLYTLTNMNMAFRKPMPSPHPQDLVLGILFALSLYGFIYCKSKHSKKFRKGVEHGSARWGNADDIKPFIDKNSYTNNILLTQTERLTVGKPTSPKYARNRNVLVVGGSGSGKTRFFVKPNLLQQYGSFCVTDPKGVRPDRV